MDWTQCSVDGIPSLQCIPALFETVRDVAFMFAGVVALFFILYAGIKYINSGGDAKTVESAQKTLTYAIIGLIIVILSFFIVRVIAYFTGATCITMFGFDTCPIR